MVFRFPRGLPSHQGPRPATLQPRRHPPPERRRARPRDAKDRRAQSPKGNFQSHEAKRALCIVYQVKKDIDMHPRSQVRGQYDFSQRFLLARRTFYLGADEIRSLRRRIDDLASAEAGGDAPKPKPVSTFVALAALSWTAFVRSKGLAAGDDTYLAFLADLRSRLDPCVSEAYLGNCVRACLASCADAADLLGQAGILRAARAVQAAVAEMEAAPLSGTDKGWMQKLMRLPFQRLTNVAASPRFRAYEAADFGFGKPARVELVSMNHDGEMVLVGGRGDGEVQASVSINPAHMDAFKACILG
uniref:Anthocyanin 5-aromatic acyltransferase n=1 Tax=Aegilops tauschii subsp. strangulata TaxID=200361 RepID=A0A453DSE4_AEGTS